LRAWGRVLLLHLPVRRLRAQERPVEVGVHHVPPGVVGQLLDRDATGAERAGVVEQQVDPAEALDGRGEQGAHVLGA
jgi:hypothetical protein